VFRHGIGKVAEFEPGDVAYIPKGFGHAIVITWKMPTLFLATTLPLV